MKGIANSLMIDGSLERQPSVSLSACNEFSPKSEIIERVRNKYISTLTLYSDEEFERYFTVFRKRVEEDCGDEIIRHTGFDFSKGFKEKAP